MENLIKEKAIELGKESLKKENKSPFILGGGEEGFEMCRTLKTPEDFELAIRATAKEAQDLFEDSDAEVYWRARYKNMQIEWVYKIMQYVWGGWESYSSRAGIAVSKICKELGIDEKELGFYKNEL